MTFEEWFESLDLYYDPVYESLFKSAYDAGSNAQREWIGLTDEEITELFCNYDGSQFLMLIRDIEAKLKEKNAYGWQSVSNPTEYLDELRGGKDT